MRGYLSPDRSGLSPAEHREYFKSYCGLCQQLRRDYGRLARFLVNRDAVTLMLVTEGLATEAAPCRSVRCGANPWRHPARGAPEALRFAAAVSVVLFASKLQDTIEDARGITGVLSAWFCRLALWLIRGSLEKARALLDEQGFDPRALDELWDAQRAVEASPDPSLEASSRATAEAAGLLFAHTATLSGAAERDRLEALGRALGRKIYLRDAWDDLEADRRRGHFNALLACSPSMEVARAELVRLHRSSRDEALGLLDSIPWIRHEALLRNVVSHAFGLPSKPTERCEARSERSFGAASVVRWLRQPARADCDCCCPCEACDCGGDGCDCCDCDCCDSPGCSGCCDSVYYDCCPCDCCEDRRNRNDQHGNDLGENDDMSEARETTCPNCQTTVPAGTKTCPSCGAELHF